jgi:hypothetical protein
MCSAVYLQAEGQATQRTYRVFTQPGTEGKRKASKQPQLRGLLLWKPLVSARMIQRTLKVSPEGASYLLRQLGPGPREVTGQRSHRVCGI